MNLNRGRNLFRENRRFFCPRILALLAISQTHRRADFILRDVLEALEVLAGVLGVAGLLVGARKPEFRRRVQRVQLECMLESFNGLRILLGLGVNAAQEVPCIGIVGIDFDDVAKRVRSGLRVAGIFIEQSEVVPRVRIFGIALDPFQQNFFCLIHPLQV